MTLPLVPLLVPLAAQAQDVRAKLEGGVSGGITAFSTDGELDVAPFDATPTEAELDLTLGFGDQVSFRLDADAHFDFTAEGAEILAYPSRFSNGKGWLPEWAALQLGREKYHLRLGLLNPNIGLEDWDPWVNYAPSYSTNFISIGPGRFAGAEASMSLDSTDLFVFGGYDADWGVAGAGVGVASEQDAWSTWSGLTIYPSFTTGCDGCVYVDANPSFEFYPADALWISADTHLGLKGSGAFFSEQLVVNVVPEAVVNPYVRGELLVDPDEVIGAPPASASLGARTDLNPTDGAATIRIMLEGKSYFLADGVTSVGGGLLLAVHNSVASPYAYQDPFGDEEE